MTTTDFLYFLLTFSAACGAMDLWQRESKRDLMMLQQNSYRNSRYMTWLRESGDTTSIRRLCGMAVFLLSLVWFSKEWLATAFILIFSIISDIQLSKQKYKKPLVWTPRATRIYCVMTLVPLACAVGATIWFRNTINVWYMLAVIMTGLYCASHILVLGANFVLRPVEKHINNKYYRDAENRLRSMPDLKVIGITGSYGKTSTKHYLERILSEQFQVRMTPGSFNTTLGVIRTVREHLKPYDEIFIVEMGAKQRGDIKEICELVRPQIGIVTAVGPQHLQTFKTVENVRDTKFELIDALPSNGLAVINNDFPMIANREVSNCQCIRYGTENCSGANYTATNVRYSRTGTDFTVNGPEGFAMEIHTRLVGECNITNLLAAIIVALKLDMPAEKIKYAVEQIEPVEHRLSMKRTPGGVTIIDDAFNSNPHGSKMAMDVLAMMTPGKRIVVTPGMVELGAKQYELNVKLGEDISRSADVAIIVGEYNRAALTEGIECGKGGIKKENVLWANTFSEAQQILKGILSQGDTVLYENDLPDTFK